MGSAPADAIGDSVLERRRQFCYTPQGLSSFEHVEWRNDDLEGRLKPLTTTTARKRPDVQQLHNRVSVLWKHINATVPAVVSPEVADKAADVPSAQATLCLTAGRCLCGREGARIARVVNRIGELAEGLLLHGDGSARDAHWLWSGDAAHREAARGGCGIKRW